MPASMPPPIPVSARGFTVVVTLAVVSVAVPLVAIPVVVVVAVPVVGIAAAVVGPAIASGAEEGWFGAVPVVAD
jgi:hypothetical protein